MPGAFVRRHVLAGLAREDWGLLPVDPAEIPPQAGDPDLELENAEAAGNPVDAGGAGGGASSDNAGAAENSTARIK